MKTPQQSGTGTPRTDAETRREPLPDCFAGSFNRMVAFSRQLETELTAARAEVELTAASRDSWKALHAAAEAQLQAKEQELAEAKAVILQGGINWDALNATMKQVNARSEEALQQLAEVIWRTEYQRKAPHWRVLDTVSGIISQIDNMFAGVRNQRDEARQQLAARDATIAGLRDALESAAAFISEGYPSEPDTHRLNYKEEERARDCYQAERESYNTKQEALLVQIRAQLAQVPPPKPDAPLEVLT